MYVLTYAVRPHLYVSIYFIPLPTLDEHSPVTHNAYQNKSIFIWPFSTYMSCTLFSRSMFFIYPWITVVTTSVFSVGVQRQVLVLDHHSDCDDMRDHGHIRAGAVAQLLRRVPVFGATAVVATSDTANWGAERLSHSSPVSRGRVCVYLVYLSGLERCTVCLLQNTKILKGNSAWISSYVFTLLNQILADRDQRACANTAWSFMWDPLGSPTSLFRRCQGPH